MTHTMTDATADQLVQMDDDQFRAVVDRAIRKQASPEELAALRSTGLVVRWHNHLMRIKTSVEGQMASREARYEEEKARAEIIQTKGYEREISRLTGDYQRWLKRTRTFHSGLVEQVWEAREVLVQTLPDVDALVSSLEAFDRVLERNREMYEAIRRHRDNFPADDDPSEDDERLWALIESTDQQP